MVLADYAGKKYKLTSSKNFDEYMSAMGVGYFIRKMVASFTPVLEMRVNGDQFTITTTTALRTMSITFKLDEPFDQELPDGKTVKTTITLEGDSTLIETREGAEKTTRITREFSETEVKMTMSVDNIVCTRCFTLQD